jgi:hypothetical protein
MKTPSPFEQKSWREKFTRSGYFIGAVAAHLVIFVLVATYVVFPAKPTLVDDTPHGFTPQTPKPNVGPPDGSLPQPNVDLTAMAPSPAPKAPAIISGESSALNIALPNINVVANGSAAGFDPSRKINVDHKNLMDDRVHQIRDFVERGAHRTFDDISHSGGDPFPSTSPPTPMAIGTATSTSRTARSTPAACPIW